MNYLKVKDHPNLVRDTESKAILNINADGLNKYRSERERILKEKKALQEVDVLKSDMETVKDDVKEIKELLRKLLER